MRAAGRGVRADDPRRGAGRRSAGRRRRRGRPHRLVAPGPLRHVHPLGPVRHPRPRRVGAIHGTDPGERICEAGRPVQAAPLRPRRVGAAGEVRGHEIHGVHVAPPRRLCDVRRRRQSVLEHEDGRAARFRRGLREGRAQGRHGRGAVLLAAGLALSGLLLPRPVPGQRGSDARPVPPPDGKTAVQLRQARRAVVRRRRDRLAELRRRLVRRAVAEARARQALRRRLRLAARQGAHDAAPPAAERRHQRPRGHEGRLPFARG